MDARWKGSNLTTRLLAVALMLTAWSAVAQGPTTIDDAGSRPALVALDATSIARDVVLITLSLTGPAPDVTSFTWQSASGASIRGVCNRWRPLKPRAVPGSWSR